MSHWMRVVDLGLDGILAGEWDDYIRALNRSSVYLTNSLDVLCWSWNVSLGEVTAKEAYATLSFQSWRCSVKWWHRALWDWNIPIKIKLFCWLLLENKVLTWDNLQKKGGMGPSICMLCLSGRQIYLPFNGSMLVCSVGLERGVITP
jgi:hypothetical protein